MIEYFIEATTLFLSFIGLAICLGIVAYAISKGWHKAKAEFSTTIHTFTNPPK